MPKVSPTQNNFTAGELSPWLLGRFDIAKYSNAAKTLENILIHQAGGAQRRPGTKYVAEVENSDEKTRLVTFEFSTTQAYILEFGNEYIRFFRNQGVIEASPAAYELATFYKTEDLFDLQFAQDADVMWITHPNYKPRKLTRTAHNVWTWTKYEPTDDPFGKSTVITGATQAEPIVISSAGHGYSDGDKVLITEVVGMTELNGNTYIVTNKNVDDYELYDEDGNKIDGTVATGDYSAYVSDGIAENANQFPSCVAMFEQRILFANTNNKPQTIWGSYSGDFEVMTIHTDAGDGFEYAIATDKVNAIRWLKPGPKSLLMGTLGATFSLSSGNEAVAITPTNVSVKRDTTYGAANILPETIGNFIYYVGRDLNHLRELGFSFDIDAQQALDMTILADHIAKAADPLDSDGFTQIAYQQSPVSRLWCVRNDGQLAVLTRQIDQEVIGWSRQVAGADSRDNGVYESVAIIPTDGGDDEVWVIVKRYINGSVVRYVEYFMPETFDHQQDAFFVDSGLSLDSPKAISAVTLKTVIDDMEYASDSAAQNAYVSSDTGIDSLTKLLLHCDGADGAIAFTDEIGKTVAPNGSAQLDTAQKKFGTASGLFNGITDYLTIPDSTDWNFGTGDFTIDFWVRFDNLPLIEKADYVYSQYVDGNNRIYMYLWNSSVAGTYSWKFRVTSGTVLTLDVDRSTTVAAKVWYHIAIVRSGNNFMIFQDGVQLGTTEVSSVAIPDLAGTLYIGLRGSAAGHLDGWLDEYRVSKGVARWTTRFTPSEVAYSEDPNLQCYSESTLKQQGAYSLKAVAALTNSKSDTLTRTLATTISLSGKSSIKLDVRASRTGENFKIGFHDDGGVTTEHTPDILVADEWQTETIDISAVANGDKDVIDSIIITILNADAENTFYIDNIYSPAAYITITATSHGFVDADEVRIVDIIGTTELNGKSFVVDKLGDHTFALKDSAGNYIDGSGYTAYISGGEARKKATTIEGLTHLVGEEVAILAEGAAVTTKIVNSSGEITLDASASLVHAGLPYTSDIELLPMPEGSATGTAVGKIQRIYKLIMKVYRSLSLQFGPDADNLLTLSQSSLFTGDKVREYPGDWDRTGAVLIRQSQPLPLNMLSVTLISEVVDD